MSRLHPSQLGQYPTYLDPSGVYLCNKMASVCEKRKLEINTRRKWSERENIRFMELYEAEESLWNVRLAEYKNKDARNSALERIRINLNIPGLSENMILKKINAMRTTYKQEAEKIKASTTTGASTEDIYVPSIAWFEIADRFLRDVMKIRNKYTNLVSCFNNNCSYCITNYQ